MSLRLARSSRSQRFMPRALCACVAVATATLGLGAAAAVVAPAAAYAAPPTVAGAGIYNFGDAPAYGSTYGQNLNQPVVGATLGVLMLGEVLGPAFFGGAALIAAGVLGIAAATRERRGAPE